jgi:hypothetical protein
MPRIRGEQLERSDSEKGKAGCKQNLLSSLGYLAHYDVMYTCSFPHSAYH